MNYFAVDTVQNIIILLPRIIIEMVRTYFLFKISVYTVLILSNLFCNKTNIYNI